MSPITLIIIVVLVLLLAGSLPVFPHSASWGFMPGGVIGLLLLIVIVLILLGRL